MNKGCAAVSWGPGRIDLFWVDDDSSLVHRAFQDGAWGTPESLGGTLISPPAATAWAVDQLQVFAIFPDGALWNRYWDGERWHDWESLGGELTGPPAASSWGADRIDVWASGRDGRDLASLVGRDALGGLGASQPLTDRPERQVRRNRQIDSAGQRRDHWRGGAARQAPRRGRSLVYMVDPGSSRHTHRRSTQCVPRAGCLGLAVRVGSRDHRIARGGGG